VLTMRNLKRTTSGSSWGYRALKDAIIAFVGAFALSAPKKRKLIRFGTVFDEDAYNKPWKVGPLVKVSDPVTQAVEKAMNCDIDDETTRKEDPVIVHAKRIFDQAYHAPRVARWRRA
jgi:hypothetical protein